MSPAPISHWLAQDSAVAKALTELASGGSLTLPAGAWSPAVAAVLNNAGPTGVVVVVCATGRESDQIRDELRGLG